MKYVTVASLLLTGNRNFHFTALFKMNAFCNAKVTSNMQENPIVSSVWCMALCPWNLLEKNRTSILTFSLSNKRNCRLKQRVYFSSNNRHVTSGRSRSRWVTNRINTSYTNSADFCNKMRYSTYWLARRCKSRSMSAPVTQHSKEPGRNRVKPHVPICGLLYDALRHAETIQSRMVGCLMKENFGKEGGKWSNWDTEWEFEEHEKKLKIVGTPAAR